MVSIRIRRAVAVLVLAAAASILPLADLHAAARAESHEGRAERSPGVLRAMRQGFPVWGFLLSLWENAGLRIDDNG
jgi:hypothetical protein